MTCTDCSYFAKETRKTPPHCTHPKALDCIRQRLPQPFWYGRSCTICPISDATHIIPPSLDPDGDRADPYPLHVAEELIRGVNGDYCVLGRGKWRLHHHDTELTRNTPTITGKSYDLSLIWVYHYSDLAVDLITRRDGAPLAAFASVCGEFGSLYGDPVAEITTARIDEVDGRPHLIIDRDSAPPIWVPITNGRDRWSSPDIWTDVLAAELIRCGHPIDDIIRQIADMPCGWDELPDDAAGIIDRAMRGRSISEEATLMIPGRPAPSRRTREMKQTMLNMWGMII